MVKKLDSIFECGRMMLPEQSRRIVQDDAEQGRRELPVLGEQELEVIGGALYRSMEDHAPVTLAMYDPFREVYYKGIVMHMDWERRRIKLRWSDDDWDWIDMDGIMQVVTP